MAERAAGALAAIVSIGAATKSIFSSEENALELKRFADQLGLNIEELSNWGDAQKKVGGSVQGLMGDVKQLNSGLNLMQQTFGGAVLASTMNDFTRNLQANGIVLLDNQGKIKNWAQIYMDEALMMEKMPKNVAFNFSTRLGNSEEMTRLLQQGPAQIQKWLDQAKLIGPVTEASAAKAEKFAQEWANVTEQIRNAGLAIGGLLARRADRIAEPVGRTQTGPRRNSPKRSQ